MKYAVSGKGKYLLLPVWAGAAEKDIKLSIDGKDEIMLMLPIGAEEENPSYFAPISLECLGCDSETHCAQINAGEWLSKAISLFSFSDSVPEPEPQENRPECHFTAKTGWINDPNGMVFKDGVYHLYFQYNPFNTSWENMCWGHAESRDLLHWEQKDTVLFPSACAHIFSGSAIQNTKALLGLNQNALIYFYTHAAPRPAPIEANRHFTQKIAFSTDGGKTLKKISGDFIPTLCADNRDPKVFFHSPTEAYICVLWLEKSTYAIFRSTNLQDWTESQRISFAPAWECPDLFELDCKSTNEKKWVFWSADGYYLVGSFDGYKFKAEQQIQKTYLSKLPYAAQTFSGIYPRVVSIAWLRTQDKGRLYHGAMSLPREFSLVKKEGKYLIAHNATAEFLGAEKEIQKENFFGNCAFKAENTAVLLDLDFAEKSGSQKYCIKINGEEIFAFDIAEKTARFGENRAQMDGANHIQLFLDGNIAELTNSDCTAILHLELLSARAKENCIEINADVDCRAILYSIGK